MIRVTLSAAAGLGMFVCLCFLFPGLLGQFPRSFPYFAQRSEFVPDDTLIFRGAPGTKHFHFQGDLYSQDLGVPANDIEGETTITSNGFADDGVTGKAEIILLGDSFLQTGSSMPDMFGPRLAAELGRRVKSYGLSWYGPAQYLELYRRFGSDSGATTAVFCFFEGNDLRDTFQFLKWKRGEGYYDFRLSSGFGGGLAQGLTDIFRFLFYSQSSSMRSLPESHRKDLVELFLGGKTVSAVLGYTPEPRPPGELLKSPEGQELGKILRAFRTAAELSKAAPVLLYIPAAYHIYGAGRSSGNLESAVKSLAAESQVEFFSLVPEFRLQAAQGELLFHPFDTHWNSQGRASAARAFAQFLRKSPGRH